MIVLVLTSVIYCCFAVFCCVPQWNEDIKNKLCKIHLDELNSYKNRKLLNKYILGYEIKSSRLTCRESSTIEPPKKCNKLTLSLQSILAPIVSKQRNGSPSFVAYLSRNEVVNIIQGSNGDSNQSFIPKPDCPECVQGMIIILL